MAYPPPHVPPPPQPPDPYPPHTQLPDTYPPSQHPDSYTSSPTHLNPLPLRPTYLSCLRGCGVLSAALRCCASVSQRAPPPSTTRAPIHPLLPLQLPGHLSPPPGLTLPPTSPSSATGQPVPPDPAAAPCRGREPAGGPAGLRGTAAVPHHALPVTQPAQQPTAAPRQAAILKGYSGVCVGRKGGGGRGGLQVSGGGGWTCSWTTTS